LSLSSSGHAPFPAPPRGHGELGRTPARWRHGGVRLSRPSGTLRVCCRPKRQNRKRSFFTPKAAIGPQRKVRSTCGWPARDAAENENKPWFRKLQSDTYSATRTGGSTGGGKGRSTATLVLNVGARSKDRYTPCSLVYVPQSNSRLAQIRQPKVVLTRNRARS
jgi:hypothetical protein